MRTLICFALWMTAAVAQAMGPAEEARLGGRFDLEVRAKLPLLRDVEVERYVERIGAKIVAGLEDPAFDYRFTPLRDDRINAFAVPGGYVYLNAGLLVRAGNDDEIAAVIGHEIAHVQAHHLARQQEATELLNYAAIAGLILSAIQPAIGAGAIAANTAVQLAYRREFEQEADYLGARYMRTASYDPRGMLDFFKRLQREQLATPTLIPPYLLTHPLTENRLTNLEAVLRQRQWDKGERRAASAELERVRLLARMNLEPVPAVLGEYRQAAQQQPERAQPQCLYGMALLHAGDPANARTVLERALALGCVEAERELGRVALLQRQPEEARRRLQRATEVDATDVVAFRELGRAQDAAGDKQAALLAYRRAVELAPNSDEIHYSLGMLAGRAQQTAEGYFHLGKALWLRGDPEQAESYLTKSEAAGGELGAQAAAELERLRGIQK